MTSILFYTALPNTTSLTVRFDPAKEQLKTVMTEISDNQTEQVTTKFFFAAIQRQKI